MGSRGAESGRTTKAAMKFEDKDGFFGNVHNKSSKYFIPETQVLDNDNIIVITDNVKVVKGNPVLVVGNNQAVYIKKIVGVGVKDAGGSYIGESYAVRLNRQYFKPYTFKNDFEDMSFSTPDTFDSLKEVAKSQTGNQYHTYNLVVINNRLTKR